MPVGGASLAQQRRDEEIELEVIDIVEDDGVRERPISMVIARNQVLAELAPLESVDDLTEEDGVELDDDDAADEVYMSELTDLDDPSLTPTPHERAAVSGIQLRPPIVGQDEHPFHIYSAATDAREAWGRLRAFELWRGLQAEVQRELGVSRATVARARLRILSDMIHYGLAASESTLDVAVDVGLAPNRDRLIATLHTRFGATVATPHTSGLTKTQVRGNWGALKALAPIGLNPQARSGGDAK